MSSPTLADVLARIEAASSANAVISDAAYAAMRDLDRIGAAAVAPLLALVEQNRNIWFDALPPLFWLVERHPVEARSLFLRQLGNGRRRDLAVRGLLRAGAAPETLPLLRDPSPSIRLGAAFTLACAPDVDATRALVEALRDEEVGETALALRLALLRRGVCAKMSESAFALGGADTPAHAAWTRVAWLRDGAIREVMASFDGDDDAGLDATLAARAKGQGSPMAPADPWRWASGAALSPDAARGLDALLRTSVPYGGDEASAILLLACVRHRLDGRTGEALAAHVPLVGAAIWASDAWIEAEGARFEKGDAKKIMARHNALTRTDRPEAVQWLARAMRSARFHGHRHSLWRHVGPLVGVMPAIERLEVLPEHGLSHAGERTLQHGSLSATVRLDGGGMLSFVDPKGQLKKSLPKPRGASAPDVEAVTALHKELRRRVESTWTMACETFEHAMMAGRRFTPDAFRARFVEHPIGARIAAGLIFMTGEGRSFWMGEGAPRDLASKPVSIDDAVRIAHPIDLSREEMEGWRSRIATQPFLQLEREAFAPALPQIVLGPHDVARLLARLHERGYVAGRTTPYTYHVRHIGPYFSLVIEHAPLPWNQSSGTLAIACTAVRRDELDVPIDDAPRSLVAELHADLVSLGLAIA
ncbi:Molybdate metabolism regulator [Minicystis rosea]|nr:Molybdate metabolism regulator [Minicystis rosea]